MSDTTKFTHEATVSPFRGHRSPSAGSRSSLSRVNRSYLFCPVMPLDHDPIYCAEQIVIPPDLGDILKAYAKEVIRNEPENIFEFSAKYFAQFVTSEARISTDQLISLRQKVR